MAIKKAPVDPVNDWLVRSRFAAWNRAKYMASGLTALIPVPSPGLGTFAVTPGWHMLYDPELHKVWSVDETAVVMLHELSHLLRDHAGRCEAGGCDHDTWNRAGDAEINDDFPESDFPKLDVEGKPLQVVLPKLIGCANGLLAEDYYAALMKQPKRGGSGKPGDKAASGQQNGAGSGNEPRCGSGAGGKKLPEEEAAEAQAPGRTPSETKRIQTKVAEAIRDAEARQAGSVPGDWKVWAGEALKPPRIPWQQKLAKLCRNAVAYRAGFGAQTFSKMNRRQSALGDGVRLPAPLAPVPRIMVGFDTSGSMSGQIAEGMSEVAAILKAVGGDVDFVTLDVELQGRAKVRTLKEACELLNGGGGTDFRPLFAAAEGRNRPDVLVFVTDGYGPAPEAPPRGVNVIWLLVEGGKCPVSWGHQIKMEEA